MQDTVPSFKAHLSSSVLQHCYKLPGVCNLYFEKNSCKCCALIIAFFLQRTGHFHGNKVFVVNVWGT